MSSPFDPLAATAALAAETQSAAFLRGLFDERSAPARLDPAAVARWTALAEDPRTVVFVAVHHGNFPSLEYLAEVLRDRGRTVVALYVQGEPPADVYDAVLGCAGSLATFAELAASLPARAIYLQAHGRWAFLSRLLAIANPGLRVVQELWDWMDAFVEPAHADVFVREGLFTSGELATIHAAEHWARTRTAAFVHKHGGTVLDGIVADACVPELRIFPCPPRAWMRAPLPRRAGPWRCVHAGQLATSTSSRAAFGDLQYLPMIAALLAQGLAVTAYGGARGSDDEYVAAARTMAGFDYHRRVEVRELVAALHGQHDFGLLLYDFPVELAVGRRHLQSALASKLFVYLAAGLPVLVSPELAFMAELVQREGIGLVIAHDELPQLARILSSCDYAALQADVAQAQRRFIAEHTCDDVLALLQEVAP